MLRVVKSQERRKFRRKVVIQSALLKTLCGIMDCEVRNLSLGGARLRVRLPIPVPAGLPITHTQIWVWGNALLEASCL